MQRRTFLRSTAASGMGMALGLGGFLDRALAAPAAPGESPYGPLLPPDRNGIRLPEGFRSRIVAHSGQTVPGTGHTWHPFPDGGACFPAGDGGWIYLSNSENPPPIDVPLPPVVSQLVDRLLGALGGVGAIRFAPDGAVVDAYPVLKGTRSNCSGGVTPWGTWLSCEEFEDPTTAGGPYRAGRVHECWPDGRRTVVRPALGMWKHEMVAVDAERRRLYMTEDQSDGLFYRFTPDRWTGDHRTLEAGRIEAARIVDRATGTTEWVDVPDAASPAAALRATVPATHFNGGEGVCYDAGRVYFTTKGDDRVWVHDVEADTITVLFDGQETPRHGRALSGVDNIVVGPGGGDLYVAEDPGNLGISIITPDLEVAPVMRLAPDPLVHGIDLVSGVPTVSEVSGIAFSPDGTRLYFNSMRGMHGLGVLPVPLPLGILYEVTGPFRHGAGRAGTTAPEPPVASDGGATGNDTTTGATSRQLPATGAELPPAWLGLGAAAAAVAALRSRRDTAPVPLEDGVSSRSTP